MFVFGARHTDLTPLGYVEQEFLLEGTAESCELIGERSLAAAGPRA